MCENTTVSTTQTTLDEYAKVEARASVIRHTLAASVSARVDGSDEPDSAAEAIHRQKTQAVFHTLEELETVHAEAEHLIGNQGHPDVSANQWRALERFAEELADELARHEAEAELEELANARIETDGGEACPTCGGELYQHTETPGLWWCEECEHEVWHEGERAYSCDESGEPELVTDGGVEAFSSETPEGLVSELEELGFVLEARAVSLSGGEVAARVRPAGEYRTPSLSEKVGETLPAALRNRLEGSGWRIRNVIVKPDEWRVAFEYGGDVERLGQYVGTIRAAGREIREGSTDAGTATCLEYIADVLEEAQ